MTPMEALSPSAKIGVFIERSRRRFEDGISISDFAGIFFDSIKLAVEAVDVLPIQGELRKAMVLDFSEEIFETFTPLLIPPMALPFWFFAKPSIKKFFLLFASGIIEHILPMIREGNK